MAADPGGIESIESASLVQVVEVDTHMNQTIHAAAGGLERCLHVGQRLARLHVERSFTELHAVRRDRQLTRDVTTPLATTAWL